MNFVETVPAGVIQSVRHQAQTVDTNKTHLLLAFLILNAADISECFYIRRQTRRHYDVIIISKE